MYGKERIAIWRSLHLPGAGGGRETGGLCVWNEAVMAKTPAVLLRVDL